MADLKIRDVSEHLVAFFRQRASANGVSLEEELRRSLAEVQAEARRKLLVEIDAHREAMGKKYGVLPDSAPGIRAERDGDER